ncbi:glycoside hydrolase family 105 protein [Aplosporella prunicola CBS 121167]|uniref:Glycoside hydrolase family 105 protein n=1 Tax=Aplosporella prunicola CBS 121167 TaxID=1176127 RepID=A0A6A6B8J0_9PEZI|nr:glycoside hydrolase family 105 protein [Aplosporella prunicola CBS 121167]KAF2140479.1 glycoside hydrolase family 105 protein [Aplosporella prunicola CBS 121167]
MKLAALTTALATALLPALASAAPAAGASAAEAHQPYSTWMGDSFIAHGVNKTRKYQEAVLYHAYDLLYTATQNRTYLTWVQEQVDGVVAADGTIDGYPDPDKDSLDDVLLGRVLLDLYAKTNGTRYKAAAAQLREQLNYQPRTPAGGFWHRRPTYPDQMWLDGIYMADVFYAQWTATFDADNATAWDDVALQFSLIEEHTRNKTSNLLVHGYDESKTAVWADPETGAAPHVWSRALGWYAMALLDVLDVLPASHSAHSSFLSWYQTLVTGLLDAQDAATGGWWLIMDAPYPGKEGNYIESSAVAMFTFALLKGARLGYVEREDVLPAAKKAYEGMVDMFVARNGTQEGTLNWEGTVEVGSLSGNATYEYYTSVDVDENDLKGVGPFIYASLEYEALQGEEST